MKKKVILLCMKASYIQRDYLIVLKNGLAKKLLGISIEFYKNQRLIMIILNKLESSNKLKINMPRSFILILWQNMQEWIPIIKIAILHQRSKNNTRINKKQML